jgi:hypothetical protein
MRRPASGCVLLAVLVGASALVAGCGPFSYLTTVPGAAAGAIAQARLADGDQYAVYEMTAADEYIHKARELAGYARFQSSLAFGRKAADYAAKARDLASHRGIPARGTEPNASSSWPSSNSSSSTSSTTVTTSVSAPAPSSRPTAPARPQAPREESPQ